REVAAVQDEHTRVRVAEGLSDELLVLLQDRLVVPGTDTDELLHGLDVASLQRQGHRLDRLALQVQQLTLEILECPLALLLASEQRREQRVVADQFVCQPRHVPRGQVAFRWPTGRWRAHGGCRPRHPSGPPDYPRP